MTETRNAGSDSKNAPHPTPRTHRALRRVLRQAAWNALIFAAVLAAVAAGGEAYFRLTTPFMTTETPKYFHPKAGILMKPDTEVRWTNHLDFWTVSRTNSLGFLDREPIGAERAAASCHVAFIGDSFVEAKQVPIADKFHVRLEELAARELPALDITTSAFGLAGTGQINQLPYYDEFARRLRPNLVVLVFVQNDFMDNSPLLDALEAGEEPERKIWVSAQQSADGTIKLRPPDPDWRENRLPRLPQKPKPWYMRGIERMSRFSYFAAWLQRKMGALLPREGGYPQSIAWVELLGRRPGNEALLDIRQIVRQYGVHAVFKRETLPPIYEKELALTALALERFKERTDRDDARLAILSIYQMGSSGAPEFDRMQAMAAERSIPVIDQRDYIVRKGADPGDAHWAHDGHWNLDGHQWAAEAVFEWLQANRDVCGGQAPPRGE